MISSTYKFIYIHYPKTGGNTIQSLLLPYSDDAKIVSGHQDGTNRFEVRGNVTLEKHAYLQTYYDRLGDTLFEYTIITSVRHPFERFVSAYYSPHRWMTKGQDGLWHPKAPVWDEAGVEHLLEGKYQKPLTDYLRVKGKIIPPDHIIRYENFIEDLARVIRHLNLPIDVGNLVVPHVNASAASPDLKIVSPGVV